jgi:hypothetical protein
MKDRFEVRLEHLGDNEERYAVWDNTGYGRPRIVSMWQTKEQAEASADAWRSVYETSRVSPTSQNKETGADGV